MILLYRGFDLDELERHSLSFRCYHPHQMTLLKRKDPRLDLVARTGGVITRFELEKGERVGHVHQTVKKGDVLATGILEQGDKTTVVGADGAVYADYWVEYSFTLPKTINFQLQGEENVNFSFHPPMEAARAKNRMVLLGILSQTERHMEEKAGQFELTEGMEETVIIPLLKNKLYVGIFLESNY